jgi:hypothetical protein
MKAEIERADHYRTLYEFADHSRKELLAALEDVVAAYGNVSVGASRTWDIAREAIKKARANG